MVFRDHPRVGEGYVKPRFGTEKYRDKKCSRKKHDTDTQQPIPSPNGPIWDTRTNVAVIALVDDEDDHGSNPMKVYL
jgi:hypothetical protein